MRLALTIIFLSITCVLRSQSTYVLHEVVGDTIDRAEKIKYHLFTFWSDTAFDHAEFIMQADSSIVLLGTMKNGRTDQRICTKENIDHYHFLVRYYAGLIPEQPSSSEAFGKFLGGAVVSLGTAVITYVQTHRGRR